MTKNRCSNNDIRRFVEYRDEFETNNKTVYGQWKRTYNPQNEHCDVYVVYSYGMHFPMYVWDDRAQVWVGNKDKYSRTTTNHQNKARPSNVSYWFDTEAVRRVAMYGVAGAVAHRME